MRVTQDGRDSYRSSIFDRSRPRFLQPLPYRAEIAFRVPLKRGADVSPMFRYNRGLTPRLRSY